MRIQDVWNGQAGGLIGEVIINDCYKLKELNFTPSCIVDLGSNIGIFAQFARELFSDALIICVEPDKENIKIFNQFNDDRNLILIEKAIGNGKVWHGLTAANGSGETYLCSGVGFPEKKMIKSSVLESSSVDTIRLSEIVETYVKPNDKLLIKLDIEGNEHVILFDEEEMDALRKADYICAEIHRYALTSKEWQGVHDKTEVALNSISDTHEIEIDGVHFWATKR